MKNMMNQMKKLAAACLITLGVITAAGGTSFAATTTTTCANCNGSGKAVCTWCDGKGYKTVLDYSYTCITCEGTGQAKCLHCLGKGTKTTGTPDTNTAAAAPMAPSFVTVPGTVVLPTSPVMAPTAGMGPQGAAPPPARETGSALSPIPSKTIKTAPFLRKGSRFLSVR